MFEPPRSKSIIKIIYPTEYSAEYFEELLWINLHSKIMPGLSPKVILGWIVLHPVYTLD